MAYTTKTLVRQATGFSDSTKVSDTYLDAKIAGADSVIDGKVGEAYTLPFASTPNIIAFLSLELTTAILFIDQYGEEAGDKDKGWQKRMDWVMGQLEDIRTGKLKLYGTDGTEFARNTLKSPGYFPTEASSAADAENTTAAKVTMSRRF